MKENMNSNIEKTAVVIDYGDCACIEFASGSSIWGKNIAELSTTLEQAGATFSTDAIKTPDSMQNEITCCH